MTVWARVACASGCWLWAASVLCAQCFPHQRETSFRPRLHCRVSSVSPRWYGANTRRRAAFLLGRAMPGSSSQSANRTRDALARLQSLEQATIIQRERSQTLLSHLLCLRGHQLLPSPPVISMPSMLREHPIVRTCVYVYRLPPLAYTIIWRFCLRTSFHPHYGLLACRHCREVVSRCTYSRHSQRHLPPSRVMRELGSRRRA